jgi:hypothetical protein
VVSLGIVFFEQKGMQEMSAKFAASSKTFSGEQDAGGEIYLPRDFVAKQQQEQEDQ